MEASSTQKLPPKWHQVVTIVLEVCQFIDPLQIIDIIGINRAFATAITKQLPAASWAVVAESSNAHTATIAPLLRTIVPRYAKVRLFSQSSIRNSYAVQHVVVTDVVGRPLVWLAHCPTSVVTPSILWNITVKALTTSSKKKVTTYTTENGSGDSNITTTTHTHASPSNIPALADIVHTEYTAEITTLHPKDVSLMINGKRTSANSTIPFSEMRWMTASGGGGPGRLAGLPRGADVWVVVRGYDSMGDVTVTIDAAITDPSRVGDQGEVGALKARCSMLQELVEPIDFEAVYSTLSE